VSHHKEHVTKQTPRPEKPDPRKNHFLARLQPEDYDALMRVSKIVPLKFRKRLLQQDEPVDAVYFPLTCMFSLLATTVGELQMELATIGKEGIVGASELLHTKVPRARRRAGR
jgi:hypothetical protein